MNRREPLSIVDLPDDSLFQILKFISGTPEKLLLQKDKFNFADHVFTCYLIHFFVIVVIITFNGVANVLLSLSSFLLNCA